MLKFLLLLTSSWVYSNWVFSMESVEDNKEQQSLDINKKVIKEKIFEDLTKQIVSIEVLGNHSKGTGFIVDLNKGIIATNNHVVGSNNNYYEVKFFNGTSTNALYLFSDPWDDIAFLKMKNLNDVPSSCKEVELEKETVKRGSSVYVVGNSKGHDFSFQKGKISKVYVTKEPCFGENFEMCFSSYPGSSGSPVFNNDGLVVGIVWGGTSNNSAIVCAYPSIYVSNLLQYLSNDKIPKRYKIEASLEYKSLSVAEKNYNTDVKNIFKDYDLKFKDSFNNILRVNSVISTLNEKNILECGDIITHVDGVEIGPKLSEIDCLIDSLGNQNIKTVKICILRDGKKNELDVPIIEVTDEKDRIDFLGRRFSCSSTLDCLRYGVKNGSILMKEFGNFQNDPNTIFKVSEIIRIDNKKIESLNELHELIENLKLQSKTSLSVICKDIYSVYKKSFFIGNTSVYDESFDPTLKINRYFYDSEKNEWKINEIKAKNKKIKLI